MWTRTSRSARQSKPSTGPSSEGKGRGAPVFRRRLYLRRAISRILSPELSFRRTIISLTRLRFDSKPDARPIQAADATNTRRLSRAANGPEPDRQPGLLLCLAPHGVFRAPELARRAVGSYPAFSPLPASALQQVKRGSWRSIFCDTFRRSRLEPREPPRLLHGMLPYGVRTFLPAPVGAPSDRLPSASRYNTRAIGSQQGERRGGDSPQRRKEKPTDHQEGYDEFADNPGQRSKEGAPGGAARGQQPLTAQQFTQQHPRQRPDQ